MFCVEEHFFHASFKEKKKRKKLKDLMYICWQTGKNKFG